MAKRCPKCNLIGPDTLVVCDCGFHFVFSSAEDAAADLRRRTRLLLLGGFGQLTASVVGFGIGFLFRQDLPSRLAAMLMVFGPIFALMSFWTIGRGLRLLSRARATEHAAAKNQVPKAIVVNASTVTDD